MVFSLEEGSKLPIWSFLGRMIKFRKFSEIAEALEKIFSEKAKKHLTRFRTMINSCVLGF